MIALFTYGFAPSLVVYSSISGDGFSILPYTYCVCWFLSPVKFVSLYCSDAIIFASDLRMCVPNVMFWYRALVCGDAGWLASISWSGLCVQFRFMLYIFWVTYEFIEILNVMIIILSIIICRTISRGVRLSYYSTQWFVYFVARARLGRICFYTIYLVHCLYGFMYCHG